MKIKTSLIRIAAALLILASVQPDVFAIPAFARRYQISCQVCHAPAMPRLKAFGDEFAGNGFRMTEYESPRYFIPAGDDRLSLFRELPVAIRIDGFAAYDFRKDQGMDFRAPFVLKILSGGELSDHLSYYFYFLFNERGSIAGVEDALLMYTDLLGTGINITMGQFQASDPLFKGELRYTIEPYMIYAAAPGNSQSNLKYDRGIIIDKGFKSGTTILLEILNGNGIHEANEEWKFDRDKYKNFMLRLSQDIGPVTVGAFGYAGKEHLGLSRPNEIWMAGPDISINLNDKLILNAQYVFRKDSFIASDYVPLGDRLTHGGFAELTFSPKGDRSNWYLTGLINVVRSDDYFLDYTSGTLHAGYLLRRNVRLVGEFTQQLTGPDYGRLSAGFVAAF